MNLKLIAIAIAFTAVAGLQGAQGQGCGCGGGFGGSSGDIYSGVVEGGYGGYGSFGLLGFRGAGGGPDCGRGISTGQASSLWAGYCTDNCAYTGPTRQGRHGCKRRHGGGCLSGGGFGGHGGGFGGGCFGYPNGGGCGHFGGGIAASGCGCGTVAAVRGGHFGGHHCKHKARKAARGGCGLCKHGCKKCKRHMAQVECSSCLSGACDACGTGGYFDAMVGYDYGNGGMQSCVSGCLTGACGCGG